MSRYLYRYQSLQTDYTRCPGICICTNHCRPFTLDIQVSVSVSLTTDCLPFICRWIWPLSISFSYVRNIGNVQNVVKFTWTKRKRYRYRANNLQNIAEMSHKNPTIPSFTWRNWCLSSWSQMGSDVIMRIIATQQYWNLTCISNILWQIVINVQMIFYFRLRNREVPSSREFEMSIGPHIRACEFRNFSYIFNIHRDISINVNFTFDLSLCKPDVTSWREYENLIQKVKAWFEISALSRIYHDKRKFYLNLRVTLTFIPGSGNSRHS